MVSDSRTDGTVRELINHSIIFLTPTLVGRYHDGRIFLSIMQINLIILNLRVVRTRTGTLAKVCVARPRTDFSLYFISIYNIIHCSGVLLQWM